MHAITATTSAADLALPIDPAERLVTVGLRLPNSLPFFVGEGMWQARHAHHVTLRFVLKLLLGRSGRNPGADHDVFQAVHRVVVPGAFPRRPDVE